MISSRLVTVLFLGVLACEFVLLVLEAEQKNIVWDELITFYVSSVRPFPVMWKALKAGMDGMAPGYYALIVLIRKIPGDARIVLRIPSLIGYLLSLAGVFWFVRKRFPPVAALSAVLLLAVLPYRDFAIEARSYAPFVGLLAVSAALWQRADEKWWAKPLLAVCLTSAVTLHYVAVVALVGFGLAELAFSWCSRRLRWSVWLIYLIATLPFLFNLPFMTALRSVYGNHYWAKTAWTTALLTYGPIFDMNPRLALAGVVVFALTVASMLWRFWENSEKAWPKKGFQLPEILLIGGWLIFPAILVVLAKIAGSGYTDRYGKPAVLGLVLGLIFLVGEIWTKPAASRVLGALLFVFLYQTAEYSHMLIRSHRPKPEDRWSEMTKISNADPSIPVVLDTVDQDLEMMYYPAPGIRQRIVRVVDPDTAVRLTGTDTSEVIHRAFGRFLSWPVEDSTSFLAAHKKFFVQSDYRIYSWFLRSVIEKKYHVTLLRQNDSSTISLVEE
jgi:hypothetical protein